MITRKSSKKRNQGTNYIVKGFFGKGRDEFTLLEKISKKSIEDYLYSHSENNFYIKKQISKNIKTSPPIPLITSSLQQKASTVLRMSPKQTMKNAQTLYENGLITYMRTDSIAYSSVFVDETKAYILETYGEKYVTLKTVFTQKKGSDKKTQDAHEAIRITNIGKTPDSINLDNQCVRLYRLIYYHTIQSLMSDYEYETTKYQISHKFDEKNYKYENCIEITIFDGWKIVDGVDFQKINMKNTSKMTYYDSMKDNAIALHYITANETNVICKSL